MCINQYKSYSFKFFTFLKLILVTFKLIIFKFNIHPTLTTKPYKLVNLIIH